MTKWKARFKYFLEIAAEASDIVIHLRERPKPLDYASIGLRVANSCVQHAAYFSKRPFKKWKIVELWEYREFLFEIAKHKYDQEIVFENDDVKDILIEINGVRCGWSIETAGDNYVFGPLVEENITREELMGALGDMVWEYLGSNFCQIGKKPGSGAGDYDQSASIFKADDNSKVYESKVANSILERSKRFLDAGYNRSIIIHGRPGTGKSSVIRYVSSKFGKNSLRINVSDLSHLTSEDMLLAIELLRPSTLLIDDFDRYPEATKLLSDLEKFNENVKLMMVTVNYIKELDDAIIRPGRFDDIFELEKIDPEIVDALIGDVPDDIRERLRTLPVAYVTEFHKRKEVLGAEEAITEIIDLEKRIRRLSSEEEELPKKSKKRKRRKKLLTDNVAVPYSVGMELPE